MPQIRERASGSAVEVKPQSRLSACTEIVSLSRAILTRQCCSEDITKYGLYITEDDGEVDWDFPCLDPRETISKYEFTTLALVEMKPSDRARHDAVEPIVKIDEELCPDNDKEQEEVAEDLARMEGHTTAMEAPLYQLYR